MFRSKTNRILVAVAAGGLAVAALGAHLSAQSGDDGASRRDVTDATRSLYVMVDKPMYRPGETVWFRGWEYSDKTLSPVAAQHNVSVKLVDPRGATVIEKSIKAIGGVVKAAVDLPVGMTGGNYRLVMKSDAGPTVDKTIVVSTYELPQFKKKLSFHKDSYAAGADVEVTIAVTNVAGEPLVRARVTADVWLDGRSYVKVRRRTARDGTATLRFRLPSTMSRGDGLVTLIVDYRGATESLQRRIPIAINAVQLATYPEGGDLVVGVPSAVYFAAKDLLGGPIDIEGNLVDDTGAVLGSVKSDVRGMGRFALTPVAGRSYSIALTKPIAMNYPVRPAKARGCVLREQPATAATLSFDVTCSAAAPVALSATVRGQVTAQVSGHVAAGTPVRFALPVADSRQGVARITLRASGKPVAEKLVYRGLGKGLAISVETDRNSYAPRDQVTLAVTTRRPDGKPVQADLALAVVDESVINLADDKSGHILSKIYLEPEMPGQVIEDPNFYFTGTEKAEQGLGLLLATQGWRRFR